MQHVRKVDQGVERVWEFDSQRILPRCQSQPVQRLGLEHMALLQHAGQVVESDQRVWGFSGPQPPSMPVNMRLCITSASASLPRALERQPDGPLRLNQAGLHEPLQIGEVHAALGDVAWALGLGRSMDASESC